MRDKIPTDFTAAELEQILGCHVTTVELHALVERGELTCDECCKQCVLPHLKDAELVSSTRPTKDNGRPRKETPAEFNARMQMRRTIVRDGEELYRDSKGMPLTIDRAPCLFNVADEGLFQTWLDAKVEQKENEIKRRIEAEEAVKAAFEASEAARLAAEAEEPVIN